MLTALGLLAMVAFIVGVVAFAAGVTWIVVRYSPGKRPADQSP